MAMLRRPVQELDPHAEFGNHEPYFSLRLDRTLRGSEQQLDSRVGGERGLRSQETSTETESHQRAADGRIVLLSRLQMQPFFQTVVRGLGECRKLNADTTTRILPGNRSGGFDHGRGVRERKGEGDKSPFLARQARKPDREPALAKPGDGGLLALSILESEICGDINFQPDGPAPLSFQEGAGSSKTRLRLFGRDRFVDNKVRAQLKCSL